MKPIVLSAIAAAVSVSALAVSAVGFIRQRDIERAIAKDAPVALVHAPDRKSKKAPRPVEKINGDIQILFEDGEFKTGEGSVFPIVAEGRDPLAVALGYEGSAKVVYSYDDAVAGVETGEYVLSVENVPADGVKDGYMVEFETQDGRVGAICEQRISDTTAASVIVISTGQTMPEGAEADIRRVLDSVRLYTGKCAVSVAGESIDPSYVSGGFEYAWESIKFAEGGDKVLIAPLNRGADTFREPLEMVKGPDVYKGAYRVKGGMSPFCWKGDGWALELAAHDEDAVRRLFGGRRCFAANREAELQ